MRREEATMNAILLIMTRLFLAASATSAAIGTSFISQSLIPNPPSASRAFSFVRHSRIAISKTTTLHDISVQNQPAQRYLIHWRCVCACASRCAHSDYMEVTNGYYFMMIFQSTRSKMANK